MKSLSPNLKYVLPKIREARRIILFLDYDGTLTPIVRRPEKALLPKKTRTILKKLAIDKRVTVSIVTGRSIRQIKKFVGISDIYYAGNHGLEIGHGKKAVVIPQARKSLPIIAKLRDILKKELKPIKNTQIEDKGSTVAIHYRRVADGDLKRLNKIVADITKSYIKTKKIKIGEGKKVLEIRPPVKWDKGKYCLYLLKKFKGALPIYIGDDVTDEDAFKALKRRGITIFVKGEKKSSLAQYYVNSTREVVTFLMSLRVRQRRTKQS